MPLAKPIIDIAINDGAFKNFYAMFEKYKSALGEMPAGWKAVGDEMGKTGTVFEQMLAAMMAQKAITEAIAEEEKKQADEAERKRKAEAAAQRSGALHWKDMARTTRTVAGNIFEATTSLLKWVGIGSFITGAGGLWGINRLANDVAGGRRSAAGLGVSYGEQKAFGIDFGSTVDGGAFLTSINQALHSMQDRSALSRAGLGGSLLQGSTADVGVNLLTKLKQIADNTKPAVLADVMRMRGLDQFVSLEDMIRIQKMTQPEFDDYKSHYATDSKDFDLSHETQLEWMKFTQTMDRAGAHIENTFAKSLVELSPQLRHLSESFMTLMDSVAQSPVIKKWITDLATGLEHFATEVGKPEFQRNVEEFVKAVGKMAEVAWRFAKFFIPNDESNIGSRPEDKEPIRVGEPTESFERKKAYQTQQFEDRNNQFVRDVASGAVSLWDKFVNPKAQAKAADGTMTETGSSETKIPSLSPFLLPIKGASNFSDIESRHKLQPGILQALYEVESSSGRDNVSKAGALGPFQFMPKTAKEMGIGDPMDLGQSSEGAGRMLERLMKEFKGDVGKAVAAYNWGAGNVHSVEGAGSGWVDKLPAETKSELARVLSRLATASITRVDIHNNSGANVIAQTAQVAQ